MSMLSEPGLDPDQLRALAALDPVAAQARLVDGGQWTNATALALAEAALAQTESDPAAAQRLFTLAEAMAGELDGGPTLDGLLAYAAARLAVVRGTLGEAEAALRRAQAAWQQAGDVAGVARSELGLTQVLTMQGNFVAATAAAENAVAQLTDLVGAQPQLRVLLVRAQRNLGTVLVYQDRHAAARDAYLAARGLLGQLTDEAGEAGAASPELTAEFGHTALNLASTYTFLDAPEEAEAALAEAVARFETIDDMLNRGRAATNLGRLYLRQGAYAAALAQFDRALVDLLGPVPPDPAAEIDAWRVADELLLEHALAYVALNLLPEAGLALARCETLFRGAGQPYELAQTRFTQGLLAVRRRAWDEAGAALDEALTIYRELSNRFWANRTQLVQAHAAQMQGDSARADGLLDALQADATGVRGDANGASDALAWDVAGRFDLLHLQCRRAIEAANGARAEPLLAAMGELIGVEPTSVMEDGPFPHLRLRWLHLRGQAAHLSGDALGARRYLTAAVNLLDAQRAALPIEEVRTAFLDDKAALYADLVLNLLDTPAAGEDEIAAAFAVVERARSRALLEQLLAAFDDLDDVSHAAGDEAANSEQRAALRRQLHWLYNQLLGAEGSRHLDATVSRTLAVHESALRRLEWQSAGVETFDRVQPVGLADLQQNLAPDQQAIVYYVAGQEVMAFVVAREGANVVRHVCCVDDVAVALDDLRFQMGRAEMGTAYVARRANRLLHGVRGALARLYDLVAAPVAAQLAQTRLLVAPFGLLHQVPFHALWDGTSYWVMGHEFAYTPSASVMVHLGREQGTTLGRFVGLAPTDPRIPQAALEVTAAAAFFTQAATYVGDAATVDQVRQSVAQADVLHLATHGLFRRDNSFFSALKLADGWLDVREIYRLPLSASVVVLSACESGAGDVRGGDEVIGLMRGFLAAGAQQVVASLWNVHDATAAAFMHEFYAALTSSDEMDGVPVVQGRAAAALAHAQRWAVRQDLHPYFWAPFIAIG